MRKTTKAYGKDLPILTPEEIKSLREYAKMQNCKIGEDIDAVIDWMVASMQACEEILADYSRLKVIIDNLEKELPRHKREKAYAMVRKVMESE